MIGHADAVPGFLARAAARVRAQALDGAVIAGRDARSSEVLRARVALLTSRRHRDQLADSIEGVIKAARGPVARVQVAPARESVLANAANLRELAGLLRAEAPIAPRALASLTSLLTDGTGPVF